MKKVNVKLKLENITVESFTTVLNPVEKKTVIGGQSNADWMTAPCICTYPSGAPNQCGTGTN